MRVRITVEDNDVIYEGEVELKPKINRTKIKNEIKSKPQKNWYQEGSTIDKVIRLRGEGFFDKNKTIGDIVEVLKTKDYHLKQSDLTLPLRKIVRNELLKRTKELPDGTKSNKWTYVKA